MTKYVATAVVELVKRSGVLHAHIIDFMLHLNLTSSVLNLNKDTE